MKKKLIALLGLNAAMLTDADATPIFQKAVEAIESRDARLAKMLSDLKAPLALTDSDTVETALGKALSLIEKGKGDTAALTDLKTRLSALEGKEKARLIESLKTQGKLTVAMVPWAEGQDTLALTEWAKNAPIVVSPKRIVPADQQDHGDTVALSDNDAKIARACGLDPKDVAKANGLQFAGK